MGAGHFEAEHWRRSPRLRRGLKRLRESIGSARAGWLLSGGPGVDQLSVLGSHTGEFGLPGRRFWLPSVPALRAANAFRSAKDSRPLSEPGSPRTRSSASITAGVPVRMATRRHSCAARKAHHCRPMRPRARSWLQRTQRRKFPRLTTRLYVGALFTAASRVYVGAITQPTSPPEHCWAR